MIVFICTLSYAMVSFGLEYLSDEELATLDGYTSSAMLKEYDDEGNVIFRRGDSEPCRYDQSEESDDVRAGCETAFEDDYDAILARSFQRYLDQSLPLLVAESPLDTLVDGVTNLDLSVRLEDFNYNHFMCEGMPDSGVVRFEGISITNGDGGAVRLRSATSIENVSNTNTGTQKRLITLRSEPIDGLIVIEAIRLGSSVENAANSASLGRLAVKVGGAEITISRTED